MKKYEYKKVPFFKMQEEHYSALDLHKLNEEGKSG